VVADIAADLPAASGDTMATDIIVGQLLENAFKYSPDGAPSPSGRGLRRKRIRVRLDRGDRGRRGIGIADGDHERIFDRFFQGEAGDRRRFGGVGIGLFIVRRLARPRTARSPRTRGPPAARPCACACGVLMMLRLRRADDAAPAVT